MLILEYGELLAINIMKIVLKVWTKHCTHVPHLIFSILIIFISHTYKLSTNQFST